MYKAEFDIPILLIFFSRQSTFSRVFDQIRILRPQKLFLYQDGARENNEKDAKGIEACRNIAENIDWECEVHKLYQEKNIGCDPSEYIAQKWVFDSVEKCIIVEDDDVPSQQFFHFCKAMLHKYENDERINIISGQNILSSYNPDKGDYFFSKICAIWGWATWKRVVDQWDPTYAYLDDYACLDRMNRDNKGNKHYKMTLKSARRHKQTGIAYYETLVSSTMYLNGALNIVPTRNMITNIGIAEESTHSTSDIRNLPHGIRSVFNMPADNSVKNIFIGPDDIKEDVGYRKKVCRKMGWGHPGVELWRNLESMILVLKYSGMKTLVSKVKKKIRK